MLQLFHSFMIKKMIDSESCYFAYHLAILIVAGHFFSFICPYVLSNGECDVDYLENTDGLLKIFMAGSIIGPFLETALFQYLPITLFYKYVNDKSIVNIYILIVLSSLVFGFTHNYNVLTIIDATFAGIVFSRIFIFFRNQNKSGFFYTFLIHALFNTYAFILDDVLRVS